MANLGASAILAASLRSQLAWLGRLECRRAIWGLGMTIRPSNRGGDGVKRTQQAVPFSGGHEDQHDVTDQPLLQTDVLGEEAGGLARRKPAGPLPKDPGQDAAGQSATSRWRLWWARRKTTSEPPSQPGRTVGHTSQSGNREEPPQGCRIRCCLQKFAHGKVSQGCQGRGPGQSDSESVQKGAQCGRVHARLGGPVDCGTDVIGGDDREPRGQASGNETQQVREEQVALLRVLVPRLGQGGGAVREEGPDPGVEIGTRLSQRAKSQGAFRPRRKQAPKSRRASETRALRARRNQESLFAWAAARRAPKAGHVRAV